MAPDRIDPAFRALPLDAARGRRAEPGPRAGRRARRRPGRADRVSVGRPARRRRDRRRRRDHRRARGAGRRRRHVGLRRRTSSSPRSARRRRPSEPSRSPARWRRWRGSGSSAPTSRCTPGSSGARTTWSTRCHGAHRGEGRVAGRLVAAAARRRGWTMSRPGSPSCGRTSSTPTWSAPRRCSSGCAPRRRSAATTVDRSDGGFETMSSLAPPAARGWEYVTGTGWDWDTELARLPEWLAEKAAAPSVEPGRYDLVIDPSNLWLTIHESVGHATEYDRAIGYEAAYAGTSFATPDLLGSLRYGSPLHARHRRPHAPARAGDDRLRRRRRRHQPSGTSCATAILVGYQLDRTFAPRLGLARSNGCAFADSPHHVPLQRMANVSLQPDTAADRSTDDLIAGVDDGIYVVGRPVVVDRHAAGELPVHRPAVLPHPRRPTRRAAARRRLPGADHRLLGLARRPRRAVDVAVFGAMNCGKAQPGQSAPVGHGCPSGAVPAGQRAQHPGGGVVSPRRRTSSSGHWPGRRGRARRSSSRRRARRCCAGRTRP